MSVAGLRSIRVAALTQGRDAPAARFRVRQLIPALARRGVEVEEHAPGRTPLYRLVRELRKGPLAPFAKPLHWLETIVMRPQSVWRSRGHDVTWLSKQLISGVPTLERFLQRPVVLDVDDAMWLVKPFGRAAAEQAARNADVIVAGNSYLAEYYSQFNSNVRVVPTVIDVNAFVPRTRESTSEFVIGWTGSRTTLPFLQQLDAVLAEFLGQHPEARLLVMCDVPPRFEHVPAGRLSFVPWSPASEATVLRDVDVGIMPLPDTALTRGKCSFKMLQYMATGLPVVVSPVGSNAEILALDDVGWGASRDSAWLEALNACLADRRIGREKGARGREVVIAHYSLESAADKLAEIFRQLV